MSIWEAHGRPDGPIGIDASAPEDALVCRPGLDVEIRRLAPGSAVFISSLLAKATFRDSAEKAVAADPRLDLVTSLAELLVSRVIVGLSPTVCRPVADR